MFETFVTHFEYVHWTAWNIDGLILNDVLIDWLII